MTIGSKYVVVKIN